MVDNYQGLYHPFHLIVMITINCELALKPTRTINSMLFPTCPNWLKGKSAEISMYLRAILPWFSADFHLKNQGIFITWIFHVEVCFSSIIPYNPLIFNGNSRILKWRYCTNIRPYLVGIFPYIGLKNRPYMWLVPPINRILEWPLKYGGLRK